MNNLALELEDVSIELLSDELFDLKQSTSDAKNYLFSIEYDESLKDRIKLEFEDDIWFLPNDHNSGTLLFNFSNLRSTLESRKSSEVDNWILRIKCWVTTHLQRVSFVRTKALFKSLILAINKTNCFDSRQSEDFSEYIKTNVKISDRTKLALIQVTLNFLDYNLFGDLYDTYDKALNSISLNLSSSVRTLPPAKDMLFFDYWVEQFYKDEIKKDEVSPIFIRYYPIIIWWKLTSLLPLRPLEFCSIRRNALIPNKDGSFYLRLPRKKNKNNKKIQIIDKVWISNELGQLIQHYINITDSYGKSDTLISYRSIQSTYPEPYIKNTNATKINPNIITTGNFSGLLVNFHFEVLSKKYNLKIPLNKAKKSTKEVQPKGIFDISKQINPGDTRHLAIITLISQKYHPIEVARLAGHTTLSSYFHYANHKTYWVDLEVQKLMLKFQREKRIEVDGDYEKAQSLWDEITNRALYKAPTSPDYKDDKEIGYCTDPLKRCFTYCILCEHWRISKKEYDSDRVQSMIQETIENFTKEATDLLTNLFNIIQAFNVDEISSINPDIKNVLDQKLMNFDAVIQKIAIIKQTEEARTINE
ncbi:hypothetical protein [Cytobacillus kochii]|uniref:hypothetical protein n=1 Tax=Cytobacillus kochii TaxID=859143 RepID=UPI0020425D59|nr:hypothetical protein [Cytobacillus kochii]MCM3323298.1 hypothetical protein [Cytobacillus kochii]MCM3345693.1 hypothetical protein [Cytobacillus kochii]